MIYHGVAQVVTNTAHGRRDLYPLGHNIAHHDLEEVLQVCKRAGYRVVTFRHAFIHPDAITECAACVAALNEAIDIANEDANRASHQPLGTSPTGNQGGDKQAQDIREQPPLPTPAKSRQTP